MRTILRYGAAVGILAASLSALGPVSANAEPVPVGTVQTGSPGHPQGQQSSLRHVHCIHHHFHKYCRVYPH